MQPAWCVASRRYAHVVRPATTIVIVALLGIIVVAALIKIVQVM